MPSSTDRAALSPQTINKPLVLLELSIVLGSGPALILLLLPLVSHDAWRLQAAVWAANMLMLGLVWATLRLRRQTWSDLGLSLPGDVGELVRTIGLSLPVAIAGIAAFVAGAVVSAAVVGVPEPADLSGYDYLKGNFAALAAALAAVYVGSAFAEEVLYRGFLLTRLAELAGGGSFARMAAVSAGAVLFGVIHYQWGLAGVIQTGCMGLALGISFWATGRRLGALILAHAYMDTLLLVQQFA